MAIERKVPGEIRIFLNHVYEFKKGVRNMVLYTMNKEQQISNGKYYGNNILYEMKKERGSRCVVSGREVVRLGGELISPQIETESLSLFFDLFPCFHASHSPLCLHRDKRISLKINLKTISNKIQTDSKTP